MSKSIVEHSADWEPIDNELVIDPWQHNLPEYIWRKEVSDGWDLMKKMLLEYISPKK